MKFCCRFIYSFLNIACSLSNITSNNTAWIWRLKQEHVFTVLKIAITTTPVLVSPDTSVPFRVKVDSSDFETKIVLSQQSKEDNKWHPVAFFSKSIFIVEQNYEIHDKKMLAII